MSNTGLLVLADDTTGALDTAGALHSRGYAARVHLASAPDIQRPNQVEVIDLGIRYATKKTAVAILRTALDSFRIKAYSSLMLKVDSTLRGHVMLSIDVIRESMPNRHIFLAPAFPAAGRICIDGVYYADEQPITQTTYARDSAFSYQSDQLSDGRSDVAHMSLWTLRTSPQELASKIVATGKMVVSFDGRTERDLECVMQTASLMDAIVVGSAGVAYATPSFPRATDVSCGKITPLPTLYAVGSLNERSRNQIAVLERGGAQVLRMQPSDLNDIPSMERLNRLAYASLQAGNSVVLATPGALIRDELYRQSIDHVVGLVANVSGVSHHLVIVGGETARAVLHARNISSLRMRGEIEPGLPISVPTLNSQSVCVTKAGGFGDDHTLLRVNQQLRSL